VISGARPPSSPTLHPCATYFSAITTYISKDNKFSKRKIESECIDRIEQVTFK